jgi:hypothetical protein
LVVGHQLLLQVVLQAFLTNLRVQEVLHQLLRLVGHPYQEGKEILEEYLMVKRHHQEQDLLVADLQQVVLLDVLVLNEQPYPLP